MGGFKLTIEGLDSVLDRLSPEKYRTQVQQSFDKFGLRVETDAKFLAPVDEGHLRSAIFQQPGDLSSTVGCSVEYAAYLEFGTRKFAAEYVASLPATWQELAATAKGGGGGSFEEFVLVIFEWVKRKGLDLMPSMGVQEDNYNRGKLVNPKAPKKTNIEERRQQLAYLIARKIIQEGIKPQPYLYPAVTKNFDLLLADLKAIEL